MASLRLVRGVCAVMPRCPMQRASARQVFCGTGTSDAADHGDARRDLLQALALAGAAAAVGCVAFAASQGRGSEARCDGDRGQIFSGHVSGIQFEGGNLLKRLQDEGRGAREATFLERLSASPAWSPFVPRFNGLVKDAEGHLWLSMSNLTAGMKKPVVMDLKIGTRHWSPGEKEQKKQKELKKSATTTIGSIGLRIVGCKIPGVDYDDEGAENLGYKNKVDPSAEELPAVFRRFLRSEQRLSTARHFAVALLEHFRYQDEYVFFGSSVLMAYDAALGDEAPLKIAMIDFGHVHTIAEMREEAEQEGRLASFEPRDTGYLKGLNSWVEMLGGEAQALRSLRGGA